MSKPLETIANEQLVTASGGMNADAQWIMQHESGGNTHAKNPHSSAFGAFQMLRATRQQYMHGNINSTNLSDQYNAATKYVDQRYGNWHNARVFWQQHRWY